MHVVNGDSIWKWAAVHELVVTTTFVNSRRTPLYVFDPDPAYILPQEDGRLVLVFAWLPLPEGLVAVCEQQAGAFKLDSLAEATRVTRIPIRIQQAPAYDVFDMDLEPVLRDSTQLEIAAGFIPARPEVKLKESWCHNKAVETPAIRFDEQQFSISLPFRLEIPMRIRPPVPIPFKASPDAQLIVQVPKVHEEVKLHYTLRNVNQFGIYAAVPESPVFSVENGTELKLHMGPAPGSTTPTPAIFLESGEALERVVPLDVPIFSSKRKPPTAFPKDWAAQPAANEAFYFRNLGQLRAVTGTRFEPVACRWRRCRATRRRR